MTNAATYTETILRYRIVRHDELPEAHKQAMREQGIDPDTRWGLIYSFADREAAERCLEREQANARDWETWKLVDAGRETTIERQAWL